jgi:hypothetical protein
MALLTILCEICKETEFIVMGFSALLEMYKMAPYTENQLLPCLILIIKLLLFSNFGFYFIVRLKKELSFYII